MGPRDWTRQRTLTLDNTASAEDLIDFPILVMLDATRIDYAATQPNGEDLRFVDADGTTVLSHEIVTWDPAGTWGEDGGRVYSTAMMVLALQPIVERPRERVR